MHSPRGSAPDQENGFLLLLLEFKQGLDSLFFLFASLCIAHQPSLLSILTSQLETYFYTLIPR